MIFIKKNKILIDSQIFKNLWKWNYFPIFIFILLTFITLDLNSQANIEKIKTKLSCYSKAREIIFIHLNKHIFISGEDVLYKVYLLNASTHKIDTGSQIAYVELVNSLNQKISGQRIILKNGSSSSYFVLPDTLSTGYYYVKGFTNLMRNYNHDFYFSTRIIVASQGDDALETLKSGLLANSDSLKINFYPEGGNVLAGVENRMAFTIQNFQPGYYTPSLQIVSGSSNIISANIDSLGMGDFYFSPETNKKYTAIVVDKTGKVYNFPLPNSLVSGYSLNISNNSANEVSIKVKSKFSIGNNENSIFILSHTRGQNIMINEVQLSEGSGQIIIPKNKLKPGIVQFVLLNSKMQAQNERVIYFPDTARLQTDILIDKKVFGKNEKVSLKIKLNVNGNFNKSKISVGISEVEPANSNTRINTEISKYLDLSELSIYGLPATFSELTDAHQIDKYMITVKLEQYQWQYLRTDSIQTCNYLPENNGYILSGKVIDKKNNIGAGICVFLSAPDSFANLKYSFTDKFGRFFFRLGNQYNHKNYILQLAESTNDKEYRIELEDKYNDLLKKSVEIETIHPDLKAYLEESKKISLIHKVFNVNYKVPSLTINDKAEHPFSRFYGQPDAVAFPADFSDLPNFEEISMNIIPGVHFKKNGTGYSAQVIDNIHQTYWPKEAFVLLNNIPFPDLSYIYALDTKQIQRIELKLKHLRYGDIDLYGILSIYTNKKDIISLDAKHSGILVNNGISNSSFTYQGPDYGKQLPNKKYPDFRQTLYWNPDITPDKEGNIFIEFYTSELITKYNVNLQGITEDGDPISGNLIFETK
jgi:hypothetical protein